MRHKWLQYLTSPLSSWRGRSETFRRKIRNGIIHVGANDGGARHHYARHNLNVVWIEPSPEVFPELARNVAPFPKQKALNYLVVDVDGAAHDFHISSNKGASSSILNFAGLKDIWPDVTVVRTVTLVGRTLAAIVKEEGINLADYDGLVLDTEGSELLVLKGALPILKHFRWVRIEASDFESYVGSATVASIGAFMNAHGFRERGRRQFASHPNGGGIYDIVYGR